MGVVDKIGYQVYIKDDATGKIKKLSNEFQSAGKAGARASNQMASGSAKAEREASQLNRTLGRLQRTMTAIAGVFIAREIIRGFTGMIKMGIEYNKTLEQSQLGIAGVLAAQMQVIDANGKELTGLAKLSAAKQKATQITMDMREANLKTAATFKELIIMFQQALPHAIARGFDIKQTEQFVTAMSQAATSMGIPLNMMSEEMRAMLKGTITAKNTLIAVALDMDKNVIKSLKGAELFDYLMTKLHAFELLSGDIKKSFQGLFTDMKQELEQTLGENLFGFFSELEADMEKLRKYFKSDDFAGHIKNLNKWLIEVSHTVQSLYNLLSSIPTDVLKYGIVGTLLIGGHPWMAGFVALVGVLPELQDAFKNSLTEIKESRKTGILAIKDAQIAVENAQAEVDKLNAGKDHWRENLYKLLHDDRSGKKYLQLIANAIARLHEAQADYQKVLMTVGFAHLGENGKTAAENIKKVTMAFVDASGAKFRSAKKAVEDISVGFDHLGESGLTAAEDVKKVKDALDFVSDYKNGFDPSADVKRQRYLAESDDYRRLNDQKEQLDKERQKKIIQRQKETADQIKEIEKQMLGNIQDIWGAAFEELFTGQIRSFGDFFDTILKSFEKMLAQMTAEWVASGLMGLLTGKGFSGFTSTATAGGTLLSKLLGAGSAASTVSGLAGGPTLAGAVGGLFGGGATGIGASGGVGITGIGASGGAGVGGSVLGGLSAMAGPLAGALGMAFAGPAIGDFFGGLFNSHGPSGPMPMDIAKAWASGKSAATKAGITVEFDPNSINTFRTVTQGFKDAVSQFGMSVGKSESNYAEYDQAVDKMGSAFSSLGPDIEEKLINGGILMGDHIKEFMQLASMESGKQLKDDIVNAGYDVSKALKTAISSSTVHYDGPMSIGYSGPRSISAGPVSRAVYEMGPNPPGQRIEGGRASGGPVMPWGTYLVGERGPELLRMGQQSGEVQPMANEINLTVPIHIAGEKVQTSILKIVDGHIVERNERGVDPTRRLF